MYNLKRVFFPKNKFSYLGAIPWDEEGEMYKRILPLILLMDYKAKPFWCPRWFLRLLHWIGNDNSVVRVKWRWAHNLYRKLTKGYFFVNYKTKWLDYDLRITIYGDEECNWLEDAITEKFYRDGYREELIEEIKRLNKDFNEYWRVTEELREILNNLEKENNIN